MKFQMLGDANKAGPVRLSDVYDSEVGGASTGIAASQKALYDAYNSLNSRIHKSMMVVKQAIDTYFYKNNYIDIGWSGGAGFILQIPYNAVTVKFVFVSGHYCQYGWCNKDGVMPTIINTGANRTWFGAIYDGNNTQISITRPNGQNQGYDAIFIGGSNVNATRIANIRITEWATAY